MKHPWQFYAKIAAVCFTMGAAMELFMIKTGFYDRVTQIEASRLEETREEREKFLQDLKEELKRQAEAKHLRLRIPGEEEGGSGGGTSAGSASTAGQ